MPMRELTASDVKFTLHCEPEYESIEGNATDHENEKWIRDQLARGNEWAWCCAHVRAHWEGFHGDAYLGGCSYLSEEDFRRCTFDDMCDDALDDLNAKLAALDGKLEGLRNER